MHNKRHETDMKRIMPIIESYEEMKQDVDVAKKGGRMILWIAGAITAIGGAYLIIRDIVTGMNIKLW